MWSLIETVSEPPVQQEPLLLRVLAHTVIWTLVLTAAHVGLVGIINLLRSTHLKQSARAPQHSPARMMWEDFLGYLGWSWPLALYAALLNPGAPGGWTWDYSCPNLVLLVYFCLGTMMVYDAWSFWLHRWMHINKAVFQLVHAKHHEHQAALDVGTASYMCPIEGLLTQGLPFLGIYALGVSLTDNWWISFAGVWHALHISILGHCGHEISVTNFKNWPVLLLNPMAVGLLGNPIRAEPRNHELHHVYPRRNFSFFFTYWDDLYSTSHDDYPASSLLFLAVHALYQLDFWVPVYIAFKHPIAYFGNMIALSVLVTPAAAAAVAQWLRVPEATRLLFGWLMDWYRRDSYITYEPQGSPGAFTPVSAQQRKAAAAAAATPAASSNGDAAPVRDQGPSSRQPAAGATSSSSSSKGSPVYVFGCHPTGLISRSAFLTFGARGWRSPVSGLPKVRLAVADSLMVLPWTLVQPLVREFLLACGCLPAQKQLLKSALLSGTSVAITPGGWAESQHLQSYKLVLRKRQGFVALAAETGAHLVPVLCLGEQDVVGPVEPGFMWIKWAFPSRARPVRVVFGEPLTPQENESVPELHARYVEALLVLGKQHNVTLDIVE